MLWMVHGHELLCAIEITRFSIQNASPTDGRCVRYIRQFGDKMISTLGVLNLFKETFENIFSFSIIPQHLDAVGC